MSTILAIYIAGMLSCWLGFYLTVKVQGAFTTGEALMALIFSLLPFGNLLGFCWILAMVFYLLSESIVIQKEWNVTPFK